MKKIKRFLASFLSISILVTMTLSSGIGVLATENTTGTKALFSDCFSDGAYTTASWSNPNQMTVNSDGTVTLVAGKVTSPNESLTWTNYTMEADVKFTPTDAALFVGLVGYGQGLNGGNGYEFGFAKAANSANVQVKLFARGAGNTNHLPTEQPEFVADTWYHLKMTVHGSTIRCYIGDNLIIETENSTFAAGCPSLRSIGVGATFDNFKVSFTDDFSNSEYTTANWSNPNQMTVNSDGTVTVTAGKVTSPNESLTWTNYTMEADVKFTPTDAALFVGLVGYGQGLNGGNGYEFGFAKAANATNVQVKLFARGAGNTNHLPTEQPEFSADTWYHLKMTVDGSTIRCYIGDSLIIEAENSTFVAGCPSLRSIGVGATFDNFQVSKIADDSADDSGDSGNSGDTGDSGDSGDSGNSGDSTIINALFSDCFSDSEYTTSNWSNPNQMTVNSDGTVTVTAGKVTSPNESLTWTNYTMEADVKFTPTDAALFVGLVGYGQGLNGGNGYEFGFAKAANATNVQVKLFARGAGNTNHLPTEQPEFVADTWYHLKMTVHGSTIRCYIGDNLIIETENSTFAAGCPSLRSIGVGATFDNFKVSFTDDFSNSEYTTANWSNPNQMTVNSDGTVTVTAGKVTSPNESLTWTNYTMEADVKFTPTDAALFVGLVGYGQGLNGGNGYEFGFAKAANATNVQVKLFARGAGNTNHLPTEQPEFSADTWYHLKMTVDGNTIRCYIDGSLLIEVENSTFVAGCPSLRSIGVGATFDNFKVSKIADDSADDSGDSGNSGDSGDSGDSGNSGSSTETNWKAIRGYKTVDFTKTSKNSIILDGYGASYKTEPITLKNFSSVTISYIPRKLNIESTNNFVVGLSDKDASFVNTVNDSGNGIVAEMITAKGRDNVFAFCDKELSAGAIERTYTNKLPNINKNLKDTVIKVTFTRYEQVIDGVEYFGTFTLEAGGNTYTREIQMTDTLKALGDTFYVIAGCQLNVGNIFEITDINIKSLQTVQSVDGEWKNLYEYDSQNNGAVVNFEGGVHLFGKGAAVLGTPIVLKGGDSIAYRIRFNDLKDGVNNSFACAFLDTNTSFFSTSSANNTNGNTGTGFVLEFRSFDNYKMGYVVYFSTVTNGIADGFVNISNIVMGDMSKSVFGIQLTRGGLNADGSVKWNIVVKDSTYKKSFTYTLNKSSSMNTLAEGMYFSAGCTGKPIQATVMKSTSVESGQNFRSPQTGDTLQAGVYVAVMFCTTILLAIFVYRKRLAYEKTS